MIDEILQIKKRCDYGNEIGKAHNLTFVEAECLLAISAHESLSSKELSLLLDVSPSRGSRIVNKLVERDLIIVKLDVDDRRTVELSLSPEGQRCVIDLETEKLKCEQRLFSRLDKDQIKLVEHGLHILLEVM